MRRGSAEVCAGMLLARLEECLFFSVLMVPLSPPTMRRPDAESCFV